MNFKFHKIRIWMFTIYGRSIFETFMITWSCKKLGILLSFWRAVYKFLEVLFHEAIKRAHDVRIMLITIHLNTFILLILIIAKLRQHTRLNIFCVIIFQYGSSLNVSTMFVWHCHAICFHSLMNDHNMPTFI